MGVPVWNWLELIGIPLALAILGWWLRRWQSNRDARRESSLLDEAYRRERLRISQDENRTKEEILQKYFDRMSELLIDNDILNFFKIEDENTPPSSKILISRNLIQARTKSILRRLEGDGHRQVSIFIFLKESQIISSMNPIFSGVNLRKISWKSADLEKVSLPRANLRSASLHRANLADADLSQSYMRRAKLPFANLTNANLSEANLRDANLSGADLHSANLRKAYLNRARLFLATLQSSDLRGANLRYAELGKSIFIEADLRGAILDYSNFQNADLRKANLQNTSLVNSDLCGTNLSETDLRNTNLSEVKLDNIYYDELTKWPKDFDPPPSSDGYDFDP